MFKLYFYQAKNLVSSKARFLPSLSYKKKKKKIVLFSVSIHLCNQYETMIIAVITDSTQIVGDSTQSL